MDAFFGFDKPAPIDEYTAILTTVYDPVELSVVRSILEGEKIPHRVRERASGGMVKVIAGYSVFGTDILVPAELLDTATELLDAYRNGEIVEDDAETDTNTEDEV